MKRCYDFGPDQIESINRLAGELRIDKTDVLTNGLRLLRIAVREARKGNSLGVVAGEFVVGELVGPWSDVTPAA